MPPKRKRKATTEAGADDGSGDNASPAPKRKMTKAEKAEARERARVAMMGGPTPTKKRKMDDSSSSNKKSTPAKKSTPVKKKPAPSPAAAPASSGRKTKKQKQDEGRARAAEWAATQRQYKQNGKQKASSSPSPSSSDDEEQDEASFLQPPTTNRRSPAMATTSKTAASPAPAAASRRRRTAASHRTADNTMPAPPRQYTPATATSARAKNALEHPSSVRVKPFQYTPTIDTGVRAPKTTPKTTDHDGDDGMDKQDAHSPSAGSIVWKHKGVIVLAVMALWFIGLVARGSLVYNSKTGMLMLVGSSRMRYRDGVYYPVDGSDEESKELPSTEEEYLVAETCYLDSPRDMLEAMDNALLQAAPDVHCGGVQLPCPANAVCFKGMIVSCRGPVWQLAATTPAKTVASSLVAGTMMDQRCVLSLAVNETYDRVVDFVQEWSAQHMCFNRVDGPKPLSYYTQSMGGTKNGAVLTEKPGILTSNEGIPLYTWTTIYREVYVPDEIDDWNWNLLKTANFVHHKLVLDEGTSLLLGLTPEQYGAVEAHMLTLPCKGLRYSKVLFVWITEFFLSTLNSLSMAVYTLSWYCIKTHPYWSLAVSGILLFLIRSYIKKAAHKKHMKRVNDARLATLKHLQDALHQAPGDGLRKGEVLALHIRDSLSFELHESDHQKREQFIRQVWPDVACHIQRDNRVRTQPRPVNGTRREVWMWIAPKNESGGSHNNNN